MTKEEKIYWTKRKEYLNQKVTDYNNLVNKDIKKEREIIELIYILKGINNHLTE